MNAHDANAFSYTASPSEQLAADSAELAALRRYDEEVRRYVLNVECGFCLTPQNVWVGRGTTSVKLVCYSCGRKTPGQLRWS
jgi:hypothetical protein